MLRPRNCCFLRCAVRRDVVRIFPDFSGGGIPASAGKSVMTVEVRLGTSNHLSGDCLCTVRLTSITAPAEAKSRGSIGHFVHSPRRSLYGGPYGNRWQNVRGLYCTICRLACVSKTYQYLRSIFRSHPLACRRSPSKPPDDFRPGGRTWRDSSAKIYRCPTLLATP